MGKYKDDCPWVVVDPATQSFLCERCKEQHLLNLPKSIPDFLRDVKAFQQLHRRCKEKV